MPQAAQADEMMAICFMPPRHDKPIGHAMLIMQDDDGQVFTVDYDGHGAPLFGEGADEMLIGDMLAFTVEKDRAQRVRDYYKNLGEGEKAPFYFSRDLSLKAKFLMRGKSSTNCLHSIVTILEEHGLIDMDFLREFTGNECRPQKTAEAIDEAMKNCLPQEMFLLHDGDDAPMGMLARTLRENKGDEKPAALWIKGFKGGYSAAESFETKLYDSFTGYYVADTAAFVGEMQHHDMDIPHLYKAWMSAAHRDQKFIIGQTFTAWREAACRTFLPPVFR